jgi:dTDP-4-amino-4,6-dideoxygalactose transaminase
VNRPARNAALRPVELLEPQDAPLVFGAPLIGEEEIAELTATIRSGWLGTGPKTQEFERDFSRYVGTRCAVGTNSGTAALHLALLGLGIGPGDEVITTPLTFVATANVIEHVQAKPIFVDVRPEDGNIDPAAIAAAITPRTKAILPVHYLGALVDIAAIRAVAGDIPIVLDSAHAVEGRHADGGSSAAGSVCACYSFYVTKNLVTGEGGMLVTDDPKLAEFARVAGLHGLDSDAYRRYSQAEYRDYDMVLPGFKYNMTDLHASLGLHQLRRIAQSSEVRSAHWDLYNEGFADLEGVEVPPVSRSAWHPGHARHLYTIWVDWARVGLSRESFVGALRARGIGTGWHFREVHSHRYYRERYGLTRGLAPVAEQIAHRTVSLPLSAALEERSVLRVIEAVRSVIEAGTNVRATG